MTAKLGLSLKVVNIVWLVSSRRFFWYWTLYTKLLKWLNWVRSVYVAWVSIVVSVLSSCERVGCCRRPVGNCRHCHHHHCVDAKTSSSALLPTSTDHYMMTTSTDQLTTDHHWLLSSTLWWCYVPLCCQFTCLLMYIDWAFCLSVCLSAECDVWLLTTMACFITFSYCHQRVDTKGTRTPACPATLFYQEFGGGWD